MTRILLHACCSEAREGRGSARLSAQRRTQSRALRAERRKERGEMEYVGAREIEHVGAKEIEHVGAKDGASRSWEYKRK